MPEMWIKIVPFSCAYAYACVRLRCVKTEHYACPLINGRRLTWYNVMLWTVQSTERKYEMAD